MPAKEPDTSSTEEYRRYRIGIVVVDNDPVPEMEINRMAPPGVSIHVTRFRLPRATGEEYTGDTGISSPIGPHLTDALNTLKRIGVDAVGLCFTSSSIFNPNTFDDAFSASARAVNPTWKITTAARAIISTMERAQIRSPYVVIPPWFTDPTIGAVAAYLDMHGFAISGSHQHELPPEWDQYPRQDRFDQGAKWAVRPRDLVLDLSSRDLSKADSILIPGSGFPSLDLLNKAPAQPPLPLFTANKAVLDELLHQSWIETKEMHT